MTKVFAQEQQETNATEVTAKGLKHNIEQGLTQASDALTRALQQYNVLKTNVEYSAGATATTLKLYIDRYNLLKKIIDSGSQEIVQNLGPLDLLPAPSPDDEGATLAYNQARDQVEVARRHLLRVYPQMNQMLTLIKTPIDKKEEWALPYVSRTRDYQNIVTLSRMLGLNKAANLKTAYPVSYQWRRPMESADIKVWKTTATQVTAFKRAYPEYTFPQVLYHFTKDWDMFDRYKFKNWYKWTHKKAEANKIMEKKALQHDFVQQDQAQKFQKKKKLLLSRIDLVRKCLRDLMSNSLISSDKGNKIYKILAMLEYESYGLAAPKLAAARFRRSGKQLKKLGFTEGSEVLFSTAKEFLNPGALIKTAQEEVDLGLKPVEDKEEKDKSKAKNTSDVLRRIKTQMDKLSYTKHLDELFYIKKDLESMGRDGDAESILKIIKDDLDGLDKLNKKLTDVYTNLSRVPVELSMHEDKEMVKETPHEKVQEMPIEVTDEDIEIEEAPTERASPQPAPAQVARPTRTPTPTRPAAPKIETGIPNV